MLKIWIVTFGITRLLDIRIHINTFSRAKYFPNRMMNELDKKYVQFNHIDQWKLFLTAPWSIKNVCIVILIYWVMKIDLFSCWWDAQAKKIRIDCFIGLAEAFSQNFISHFFQKNMLMVLTVMESIISSFKLR